MQRRDSVRAHACSPAGFVLRSYAHVEHPDQEEDMTPKRHHRRRNVRPPRNAVPSARPPILVTIPSCLADHLRLVSRDYSQRVRVRVRADCGVRTAFPCSRKIRSAFRETPVVEMAVSLFLFAFCPFRMRDSRLPSPHEAPSHEPRRPPLHRSRCGH